MRCVASCTGKGADVALLDVRHLVKEYSTGRGWFAAAPTVRAVDEISFAIEAGETFGLVGESGCGKTTTGRSILRLIEPTSGEVVFNNVDVRSLSRQALRALRKHIQIVFQDPYSSLDPRMRVGAIVTEPLAIHGVGTAAEREARARELFDLVGLDREAFSKYPHEFSGGQRQRIGLARALALEPSLLVLDEPVSALDVSVQAQVVNLLLDLQDRLGLTYLFIAHDLRLVRQVCSRLAVMYRGRIVEMGSTTAVFDKPAHVYTQALLSAIPALDADSRRPRLVYDGSAFERLPLRELAPGHWAAV
jgi:oligopeptide transport system ATP-binding protein